MSPSTPHGAWGSDASFISVYCVSRSLRCEPRRRLSRPLRSVAIAPTLGRSGRASFGLGTPQAGAAHSSIRTMGSLTNGEPGPLRGLASIDMPAIEGPIDPPELGLVSVRPWTAQAASRPSDWVCPVLSVGPIACLRKLLKKYFRVGSRHHGPHRFASRAVKSPHFRANVQDKSHLGRLKLRQFQVVHYLSHFAYLD